MHLVVGTPDPVALRLVDVLVDRGERVAVLAGAELAERLPEGVVLVAGDAASIDFGLAGDAYLDLVAKVREVWVASTGFRSATTIERSPVVRQAAEVVEFAQAGGAPDGVRFLSSLLVFGNATGQVSEADFQVGQGFGDEGEESLAVAEKLIRVAASTVPLAIIRTGPVVAHEETGEIVMGSPLSHLSRQVQGAAEDKGYTFSDLPVRFETVERATRALLEVRPSRSLEVVHLVDDEPLTDRALIQWLATRCGKTVHESPGALPWAGWGRPSYSGSRALAGWGLRFSRDRAEALIPRLLDRDELATLEKLFPEGAGR